MIDINHVHPMVVHFPIVLFLTAVAVEAIVLVRGGDLAARQCLPGLALAALVLGAVAAMVAASFGDIALDAAADKGFPKNPLEEHADLGMTTVVFFGALALVQITAWWRRIPLAGGRGWIVFAVGVVGIAILLDTAYHGGELVYHYGVNVDAVKHPAQSP
jgi:uncharacterized membrane protein